MFETLEPDTPGRWEGWRGWIGAAALLIVAAAMAGTFLYAPGPPAYTLTPQSLTIHDRFYPVTVDAASVDVGGIRVIDANNDPDWKPLERTYGLGIDHYHSGWFRVSGGKTVRMYRADGSRLVLLPPKSDGTPVLLEAKDPDKLVADLQREWAPHATGLLRLPMPSMAASATHALDPLTDKTLFSRTSIASPPPVDFFPLDILSIADLRLPLEYLWK